MDNSVIYKTLKHFRNGNIVTSDELLHKRSFRKFNFDSLSSRLLELFNLGYISAQKKSGVISAKITPAGENFLADYKYLMHLTNREKWFERFIGFIFGIATSVISGIVLNHLYP